jgi:hypothetical protein
MSLKHFSDTIGNRTRDLPVCSAVFQPTTPLRSMLNLSLAKVWFPSGCWRYRYRGQMGKWTSGWRKPIDYVPILQLLYVALIQYIPLLQHLGGTRWRSWLWQCATRRKVAGSIPGCVNGIFYWHNPSGRTMALGSTQPLTEMNTRSISWGVKAAVSYGWQPYHLHVLIVLKFGSLNLLEPSGPVQECIGIVYLIL